MSLIGSYDETDSFVDYQARMIAAAKEIAKLATDMTAKAATDTSRVLPLAGEMCSAYERLARDSVGAAATTPNTDVANSIRSGVADLGDSMSGLVNAAAQCQGPALPHQQSVASHAKDVSEKVIAVLSALQAGSRGTQACIDAAATIAAIIGDLDTTILFASAGTLHSDKETDAFSDHRESILKTAKTLVEDTKTLVGGAAGSQEQLATAANSSVTTIVQLCEVVKQGAMSLGAGSSESQVLLLHAARDVAAALRDLAAATTAASGKPHQHPDMQRLKHAAKRLTETTKRWSLPLGPAATKPKRRSLRIDYNSADSETDLFQSDQEEELIKLLDYSSQDDDVSPSIFHDNCEEIIAYIEEHLKKPGTRISDDDVNDRYNMAARNSLVDMDWRVLKYGENIFLGELRKLVDIVIEIGDRMENKRKRAMLSRLKANNDLDKEMKRISQVIEDLDTEIEESVVTTTVTTTREVVPAKKPKLDEIKLTSPVFKVKKVKPVNLTLDMNLASETNTSPLSPEQKQKDESTEIVVEPETKTKKVKLEFWKMFQDDSELWKALAKRNLQKMEETRRELERFSGHELVLGDYQTEKDRYETEKATLQSFIEEVDKSKAVKRDLEYDKKYEEMVLKLIEFAKKDFIYKGFDPLIEQLKALSNTPIEKRKKKVHIQDIINIYSQIDITKYTYEELCLLEKYYKEIIRKYKHDTIVDKENKIPREERSPSLVRDVATQSEPSYHKNVILNVQTSQNLTKNINTYSNTTIHNGDSLERRKTRDEKCKNNVEIFDLTRTYPMEYYANNWWTIYEDILKTREQQFGSIDNWWRFYETVLNNEQSTEEDLERMRAVMQYRDRVRRPNSRLEEHMRMLDDVKRQTFQETEEVENRAGESVMVTNVTSLLKTVKAVEDEHTRGSRALESTIEAISQEIEVLLSDSPPKGTTTAEELVRCTRQMTSATARAVAAGNANKQDQLTAAANLGRRTVLDLLRACKAAAYTAENMETRTRTIDAGAAAATAYRELLSAVLSAVSTGDRQHFPELSRRVAHAVADIIAAAETLKGSDWVDPDDPTVIAESELLGAAASIDAAARKLDALRPRKAVKEADESLNFDEMILEAAKSIIAATSALVRAASAAQRELIDQGKVARRPAASSDDGQWSEGLVSAARLVAGAAHALVEAANALVQGAATEERLISSARQVAASTAHLLVACKVKADPTSESTVRLQAAGAAVIRSTDGLVRAARDAIHCEEERSLVLNRRMVGGIAQEIDARSEVLRIEKELEEARGRLTAIRQAKYKLRPADTSGDDTDVDITPGPQHRYKSPISSFANTTYSPNSTYSHTNNLTQNVSNLSQTIHGSPNAYSPQPNYNQTPNSYSQSQNNYSQSQNNYSQTQNSYSQSQNSYNQTQSSYNQSQTPSGQSNGYQYQREEKYTGQSPTFSSFRPQEDTPKQNYEGFTTRYETRLYDTPRPVHEYKKEEHRQYESSHYTKDQKIGYDAPKTSPMSPKFNARELKFEDKQEPIYSSLKKPTTPKSPFDGVGQSFSEHQVSTEAIPGGTKHSEFTIKSESYQSHPKTEFSKFETRSGVKSPFTTSTPSKLDSFPDYPRTSTDLVKAVTPEFDRISSPYGKDVHSYGGPNYMEETTTEVKDIPNGTQKITTTKIYSSSPVNITSTNTKYEPVKLEGIDELSKSFDNESRYSTLDSRFNTLESKMSSDTSRSFMRPSDFQSSDYQSSTNITRVKTPADLNREIDNIDKKFGKQTITSETIERKSVMTSSHKSETSSTVTKKFGNF